MYRPCHRDCSNRYLSWVIKTTTADLFVFVLLAAAPALHITGGGGVRDRQTDCTLSLYQHYTLLTIVNCLLALSAVQVRNVLIAGGNTGLGLPLNTTRDNNCDLTSDQSAAKG